jgi:hypothetical protein
VDDDFERDRQSASAGAVARDEPVAIRTESRVFPIATVAAVVALLTILPGRYRILPAGFDVAIGAGLAVSILVGRFSMRGSAWTVVQRRAVIGFACIVTALEIATLARLLYDMALHSHLVAPVALLSTAVAIWISNVAVFSLVYWEIDRDGPAGRAMDWQGRADFAFPRGDPEDGVPPNWQPEFADYLFLAFNSATAFSPTDALPLTRRAKMLMMAESAISLVTVVAVAARAINVLGS